MNTNTAETAIENSIEQHFAPASIEVKLRASTQELIASAEDMAVMTAVDNSAATDVVVAMMKRFKEIEDERTKLVKPFNEGVKQINGRFKAMQAPLEQAIDGLKGKILRFKQKEEARAKAEAEAAEKIRKEMERKAAEEAEAKRKSEEEQAQEENFDRAPLPQAVLDRAAEPVVTAPSAVITPNFNKTTYGQSGATSTIKKVWAFELVDIQALAAARPDLIQIDTVKINQEIRGRGGDIAGLRIFQKDQLSAR